METPEEGVEFYVKDGILLNDLCLFWFVKFVLFTNFPKILSLQYFFYIV